MVIRGSAVRPNPVLRSLFALVMIGALPACTSGLGDHETVAIGEIQSRQAPSVAIGNSGAGNFLAGRFALEHSDLPAASDYLLKALATDPENAELLQRSLLALASEGRLKDAAAVGRHLLTYDANAGLAAMVAAEQDAREGNWQNAGKVTANLPRRGVNAFLVPLIGAWAKVGQGDIDGALETLSPLARSSNFAALHDFHAALIADLADKRSLADQYYRSTLAGDTGLTVRSVQAAAAYYRRTGQTARAEEALAKYRRQHPGSEDALVPMGPRLVTDAKAGLAEAFLGASTAFRQGNLPQLGLIFGRMTLDLQPDFPLAQVAVADILQELGRIEDANRVYAAIPPNSPIYLSAQLRVASNRDQMGDVDGAVATLESLAKADPGRADALIVLGDVLRSHERWAEAIGAYDRAIAATEAGHRDLWALHYSRGIALERSKQWQRAEADFLRALDLRPDEPYVLNYLGYSWIEQGINLERAQRMIEKAVAQRPTDGNIVDSLGWVYYRTGHFAKAVEMLERAVELRPEDAAINDHFGDALWGVGRQIEARFQWERALSSKPDPEMEQAIRRKLSGQTEHLPTTPLANANAAK